jgi:septum formation protein
VAPADIDEAAVAGDRSPEDGALAVAVAKADATARADALVLAADTIVVLDDAVLGKPTSPAHARQMLAMLGGRVHRVLTGVCLLTPDDRRTALIESEVRMRRYAPAEIETYVAAGGGLDKAGAYGIQDEPFRPVEAIAGCWCNVMGLPLWTVWTMLIEVGVAVPQPPDCAYARCAACPAARDG